MIAHCPPPGDPAALSWGPSSCPGSLPYCLAPPFLRRCGGSPSLCCLNTSSSHLCQPPGPLHGSVSQPLRVRCPEVNSGYPLPASKFLHLVPAIHSGYSSLIFSFSLILCTACISQAQWLSAPPNISSSSTSLLLYPMLEGDCCLPPGQVQCLLNYFPIITASCMEWLSSQIHVHNLDQTCPF